MVKVLFVCTGNICRSPTADGLLRARVAAAGLDGWIEVDSAGTHGYHVGDPPDPRSIRTALAHGVDLRELRARAVEAGDFERFDIIASLDQGHQSHLLRLCPPPLAGRVRLLMSFAAPPPANLDVPDPYYGNPSFEAVFDLIEQGVDGLLEHIRLKHTPRVCGVVAPNS